MGNRVGYAHLRKVLPVKAFALNGLPLFLLCPPGVRPGTPVSDALAVMLRTVRAIRSRWQCPSTSLCGQIGQAGIRRRRPLGAITLGNPGHGGSRPARDVANGRRFSHSRDVAA